MAVDPFRGYASSYDEVRPVPPADLAELLQAFCGWHFVWRARLGLMSVPRRSGRRILVANRLTRRERLPEPRCSGSRQLEIAGRQMRPRSVITRIEESIGLVV